VKPKGPLAKEREILEPDELRRLCQHLITGPLGGAWALTFLGLRRSEILGLEWSDIDAVAGLVTVQRSVTSDSANGGIRHEFEQPKSERSKRFVEVPPGPMLDALRKLRTEQADTFGIGYVQEGWVVVDEAGVPFRPHRWSNRWRTACIEVGVPVVTLHSARHAKVTAMRTELHLDDAVIARGMGHSEEIMRANYTRVSDEKGAAANARFAEWLTG
jgi:integrase